jgi:hypothetical protein
MAVVKDCWEEESFPHPPPGLWLLAMIWCSCCVATWARHYW